MAYGFGPLGFPGISDDKDRVFRVCCSLPGLAPLSCVRVLHREGYHCGLELAAALARYEHGYSDSLYYGSD